MKVEDAGHPDMTLAASIRFETKISEDEPEEVSRLCWALTLEWRGGEVDRVKSWPSTDKSGSLPVPLLPTCVLITPVEARHLARLSLGQPSVSEATGVMFSEATRSQLCLTAGDRRRRSFWSLERTKRHQRPRRLQTGRRTPPAAAAAAVPPPGSRAGSPSYCTSWIDPQNKTRNPSLASRKMDKVEDETSAKEVEDSEVKKEDEDEGETEEARESEVKEASPTGATASSPERPVLNIPRVSAPTPTAAAHLTGRDEDQSSEATTTDADADGCALLDDGRGGNNKLTLATLIHEGLIEPGDSVMTIDYLGQTFKGDLLPGGKIRCLSMSTPVRSSESHFHRMLYF